MEEAFPAKRQKEKIKKKKKGVAVAFIREENRFFQFPEDLWFLVQVKFPMRRFFMFIFLGKMKTNDSNSDF